MEPFEFTYRNTEFELANGQILGGWPVLSVEVSYDRGTYQIEAVRFDETGASVPVPVFDFIKLWAVEDLASDGKSFLRRARLAALIDRDESREEDRGCFECHQMRGAA